MRIVLLSNCYPPDVQGGAELLAANVAGELRRQGHTVTVLTSAGTAPEGSREGSHPGTEPDDSVIRTLRLTPVAPTSPLPKLARQVDRMLRFYRRYHSRANAAELRRVVADVQPDLVYVWEITGIGVRSIVRALTRLDVPTVFHLGSYWLPFARSPETEQSLVRARWLKRWLIGDVPVPTWTSAIAVSAAVKHEYVRVGCHPDQIEVIHNSIAPTFFTTPHPTRDEASARHPVELLYVGRVCAEKGVLTALEALAVLRTDHLTAQDAPDAVHLTIIGTGDEDYLHTLRAYVHDHRLADAVTFRGQIPQRDLIAYYDRADVLLVPSLWAEPFGLVVVEAMARELAVVASDVGGIREIITPGVDGLLAAPGDARAWATALAHVVGDPLLRRRLGQHARQTAEVRFTVSEHVRRITRHLSHAAHGQAAMATPARSEHAAHRASAPMASSARAYQVARPSPDRRHLFWRRERTTLKV